MSVIEKVPFLHEIVIADAQELAQVISPGKDGKLLKFCPEFWREIMLHFFLLCVPIKLTST